MAAKSPSAYEDLRFHIKKGSGILVFLSQQTLRDYRNYICPKGGLGKKTIDFTDVERFVVLLFDEMKVQEDLVWDKNTGMILCKLAGVLTNWLLEKFLVKRLYFKPIIYVILLKKIYMQSVSWELPKFYNCYFNMAPLDTNFC